MKQIWRVETGIPLIAGRWGRWTRYWDPEIAMSHTRLHQNLQIEIRFPNNLPALTLIRGAPSATYGAGTSRMRSHGTPASQGLAITSPTPFFPSLFGAALISEVKNLAVCITEDRCRCRYRHYLMRERMCRCVLVIVSGNIFNTE